MKISADLKVDTKGLDNLMKSDLVGAITSSLSKRAVEIAKENSRVDTGDMQKGWNRAKIGSGRQGGYRIYNSVPHTIFNEYGTVRMPAQPMLGPAMEYIAENIPEEARKIMEVAVQSGVQGDSGEE